jgi:hypothetical protein
MESREIHNNLILEFKKQQDLKRLHKENFIEFDNYFKYSGKVETPNDEYAICEKKIKEFEKYHNNNRNKILKKTEKYEMIIKKERAKEYKKYIKIIKNDQ